jgi:protein phosphatase
MGEAGAPPIRLTIPTPSLVVLVGAPACGKSTFARAHFGPYEVLSSDHFRGLVAGDEADQSATADAFDLLHLVAAKRLERGLLTVVDATNVRPESRQALVELARRHQLPAVAIVLDLPEALCTSRDESRAGRRVGAEVVRLHRDLLAGSLGRLPDEGFHRVYMLRTASDVAAVVVEREGRTLVPTLSPAVDGGRHREGEG